MKLTESTLRKLVKEEMKKNKGSRSLRENFEDNQFYKTKLDLLLDVQTLLEDLVEHERSSSMREDSDLNDLLSMTSGLIDAILPQIDY
jgi:hypothetical protein